MAYSDKDSLVEHACREMAAIMQSDLKNLYQDIEVQASGKSADTFLSHIKMLEKSNVSAYVNELLKKMRNAFSEALRQVMDENGGRRYTDSQVTLMWQLIAMETAPPKLAYIDTNKVQMGLADEKKVVDQNPLIPILPVAGLGLAVAGLVGAGGVSSTAVAWAIRGASVGVGGVSAYGIHKKMSGVAVVHEREGNVAHHAAAKIVDAQYIANAKILEEWIHSIGERVKKGEPIL